MEPNPHGTGRRIGTINFENSKVRKTIENSHDVVDSSCADEWKKEDLKVGIDCHNIAFTIVRKNNEEHASEELLTYKVKMNKFCATMAKEHGRKIFTNFFHYVIANHLCDYMVE